MNKILCILALFLCCGPARAQSVGKAQTVTISKQSFGGYPAVLLDVKNGKLTKLDKDFREEDLAGDADLWVEPRDPEINCLERPEDSKLLGLSPHLLAAETSFDQMTDKNIPQISGSALKLELIKAGTAFWVQASDNAVYKVRIDRADKAAETLVLTIVLVRK